MASKFDTELSKYTFDLVVNIIELIGVRLFITGKYSLFQILLCVHCHFYWLKNKSSTAAKRDFFINN